MTDSPEELSSKQKAIEMAMAELDRKFGAGSIMRIGDENVQPMPSISTGAFTLDMALGIGGLPMGRIVEIYGMESSAKSTVCLHVVANAQKLGYSCLYIDAEQALDPVYAQNVGVNMNDLIVSQPEYGEKAFDIMEAMIKTGSINVVIVDSVAALTPHAELEADMDQQQMGLQARMMNKGLRKITAVAHQHNAMVIFVNQLRQKIGIMFGSPDTTPGGMGLKFYSSVRLDLRKKEEVKNKLGETVAIKVRAKVVKNKVSPPYKVAEFDVVFAKGISDAGCIVDKAIETGVFTKAGSWLKFEGETFAQGRDAAVALLQDDVDFASKVKELVLNG